MQHSFIAFTYLYLSTLAICLPSGWICYYSRCFSWAFLLWFTLLRDSINNSIMYTDIYIVIYIFISAILFVFWVDENESLENGKCKISRWTANSCTEKAEQNLEARKHAANRTRQRSFRCGRGKVIFYEASRQERGKRFKAVATLALN